VLANTYHLFLRPGHEAVRELGGLHRFMGWDGPILTDSGGFQVWSLAKLRHLGEDGVEFRSHVDGSLRMLSPERCVEIQQALGVDIIHPLDECLAHPATEAETERSLARTQRWLARTVAAHARGDGSQALFGNRAGRHVSCAAPARRRGRAGAGSAGLRHRRPRGGRAEGGAV
jgi:queuine tRNA-ribosyltransferase